MSLVVFILCFVDIGEDVVLDFLNGVVFNLKLMFEIFVEGSLNSLVCVVVWQMVVGYDGFFGLFYIYFSMGIGKIYLLQVVVVEVCRVGWWVVYLLVEFFMYYLVFVLCMLVFLVLCQVMKFIDFLLVDDFQFLYGKQVYDEFSKMLEMFMEVLFKIIMVVDCGLGELLILGVVFQCCIQVGEVVGIQVMDYVLWFDIFKKWIFVVCRIYLGFLVLDDVIDYIVCYVIFFVCDFEGVLNWLFVYNQLIK